MVVNMFATARGWIKKVLSNPVYQGLSLVLAAASIVRIVSYALDQCWATAFQSLFGLYDDLMSFVFFPADKLIIAALDHINLLFALHLQFRAKTQKSHCRLNRLLIRLLR